MDGMGGTLEDQRTRGGAAGVSPTHSGPRKPASLLGPVLLSPRPPLAAGVLGAWVGDRKRRRERWVGALQDQRIGEV